MGARAVFANRGDCMASSRWERPVTLLTGLFLGWMSEWTQEPVKSFLQEDIGGSGGSFLEGAWSFRVPIALVVILASWFVMDKRFRSKSPITPAAATEIPAPSSNTQAEDPERLIQFVKSWLFSGWKTAFAVVLDVREGIDNKLVWQLFQDAIIEPSAQLEREVNERIEGRGAEP